MILRTSSQDMHLVLGRENQCCLKVCETCDVCHDLWHVTTHPTPKFQESLIKSLKFKQEKSAFVKHDSKEI